MAQGLLGGIFWGGLTGVALLAVSTQTVARRDLSPGTPDAAALEVPAGSEFDQAREATDPVVPAEETRPGGEAVSGVSPPPDAIETPPAFDTSSLGMPEPAPVPSGLGEVPAPAPEVEVPVAGPSDPAPRGAADTLTVPDVAPPPETGTAAPAAEAPEAGEAALPSMSGFGDTTEAPAPDRIAAVDGDAALPATDAPRAPAPAAAPSLAQPPGGGAGDTGMGAGGRDEVAPATAAAPSLDAPERMARGPAIGQAPAQPAVGSGESGEAVASAAPGSPASQRPPLLSGQGSSADAAPPAASAPAPVVTGDAPASGDASQQPTIPAGSEPAPAVAGDAPRSIGAPGETPRPGAPETATVEPELSAETEAPDVPGAAPTVPPATATRDGPELAGNGSGSEAGAPAASDGPGAVATIPPAEMPEVDAPAEAPVVAEAPPSAATDDDARIAALAPEPRPEIERSGNGNGLPRIIRLTGEEESAPAETPAPAPVAEAEPLDPSAGALERFRSPSQIGFGEPFLSLVLLHEGGAPDAASLAGLPQGLSFAVDAADPQAAEIAEAYRRAGREVVMIPALPEEGRPQEVRQALSANFRAIPEAVAVMDTTGGGFQSDREAVGQVIDAVAASGHGLITFPRGLNTAHQRAERAGVPRGLIFRDIDGEGEPADVIGRSLDRATFRARQSRQPVILVGRAVPSTLSAIAEWAAAKAPGEVALAPVSAALLADR